jgi:hypothetical protein
MGGVCLAVATCAVLMAAGVARADQVFKNLLLADNATKKILAYNPATKSYVGQFADASGLLAGADIVAIAANDPGTKVYVAVSIVANYNAASSRIYSYDVVESGGVLTGTNPTLLYQHTLGNWGSRRSMCIGPDRNSDGKQDIYFTVPLPGWNNETVYWVDGVSGGTATSYQNIATRHNQHLEFKADGSGLGWASVDASGNGAGARSWDAAGRGVRGQDSGSVGVLKYDADGTFLMTGPNSWEKLVSEAATWRIMDIVFDAAGVIYYSGYWDDTWNDRVYRRLYCATYNSGTGYWTGSTFSGGGLEDASYSGGGTSATPPAPSGLQPGVTTFLNYTRVMPKGTVVLVK